MTIKRNGKSLKIEDMTPEEREEKNLAARCYYSQEYKAFRACTGIPIEEIPPEYQQCKEQIATLRRYEQIRNSKAAEKSMRRSVARQVKSNESTRKELTEIIIQQEENALAAK